MKLTGLLPLLDDGMADALARIPARGQVTVTATPGVRPAFVARANEARPIVVVTATTREADQFADALRCYMDADAVAVFPAWETLPHERLSPRPDTVSRRLQLLRRLAHPDPADPRTAAPRVVLMPARALIQPVATGLGDLEPVQVRAGDTVDLNELARRLTSAAYTRVDMVERRGEFAVRGGLLDVFPPTDSHPSRIELFGDTVEELRTFSVADQRSLTHTDHLYAPPAGELLITPTVRERARALQTQLPGAAEMLERIADGHRVEGMEALTALLADGMEPVLNLVDPESLVMLADPERILRRTEDLQATTEEFLAAAWTSAAAGGNVPLQLDDASFASLAEARAVALTRGIGWWGLTALPQDTQLAQFLADQPDALTIPARAVRSYRGDFSGALADLRTLAHEGWRMVLTTEGPGPGRRMVEQLRDADVPALMVDGVESELAEGVVTVTTAPAGLGFVVESERLAVVTEADLTGRAGRGTGEGTKMPSRRRNVVDPLALKPGDHVVHEQHGVGRFVELVARAVGRPPDTTTREYMVIEYAESKRGQGRDRLYVPTDSLDQVTRYAGGDDPTLSKMGGSDWAATKSKARKAIREIAAELVRLYAARSATPGYAFGPDTPWQRELEDAFPYTETPDQLVTIDEVKADMEKPFPMDRLISGDVGYGKTEIAVRAAFKAVQEGKQVAVLVPTTLLVQQHLETFSERYGGFPVTVRALSRFQSDKDAEATKEGLAFGAVDVVIGTHRLITGEVRFKDLGLVIIDEEQRFGVEHKETLKQLRTNVDVLAMSATPIPRTLEMAITGIREMSTLATPPEERHPVLTFVGPQEDRQVAAAIRRELLREGQVFYVHNRVRSIEAAATHIAELVPEARIAVAHGQMNEHQLERVITDFWNRESDVLVCTTIVETGLDITNANTLIVERADAMGLSQLHQLRGRVGRGRERAYAYFFYPPDRSLTETAHDRLATIAAHTDLGAGIQVAMKDLEIRGAGNLLGGEQSGHIAGVGFDLYVRMVADAVAGFKGEKEEEKAEIRIELPINAHIPHGYIATERLRLEAYSKIAAADGAADMEAIRSELTDRYGPIPPEVERLFAVAAVRMRARERGVAEVSQQGKFIRLSPVELPESAQLRLKRLHPGTVSKPAIRTILVPWPLTAKIGGRPLADAPLLAWLEELLEILGPITVPA